MSMIGETDETGVPDMSTTRAWSQNTPMSSARYVSTFGSAIRSCTSSTTKSARFALEHFASGMRSDAPLRPWPSFCSFWRAISSCRRLRSSRSYADGIFVSLPRASIALCLLLVARAIFACRSMISLFVCTSDARAVFLSRIRASTSSRLALDMICIALSTASRASSVVNIRSSWIASVSGLRTGAANTLNLFDRMKRSWRTFASSFCHMSTTRHAADLLSCARPAR